MEQQSNDLRERLLAALPQPENLDVYREEASALLAKHKRALRWDYIALNAFYLIAFALFYISVDSHLRVDATMRHSFQFGSAIMLLGGMIFEMRYRIYDSQVSTLKEIKQVQLQILEVQKSLGKLNSENRGISL